MLKIGSVVSLKSGGALMTVCDVDGEDIYCRWHDLLGRFDSGQFTREMLDEVHLQNPEVVDIDAAMDDAINRTFRGGNC